MRKLKGFIAVITAVMTITNIMPAYAGVWTKGVSKDAWWYDNQDGSYLKDGWHWVDGNNDGIAQCYYFDNSGWMLSNTKTPDGYDVNTDGAWVVNGMVQTKSVQATNLQVQNTTVKNSDTPLAKYIDAWDLHEVKGTITDINILRRGIVFNDKVQNALTGVISKNELDGKDLIVYNYVKDFLNSFDFENATNKEKLEHIDKSLYGTRYNEHQSDTFKFITERNGDCSTYSHYTKILCRAVNVPCFSLGNSSHEVIYAQIDNGNWIGIDNGDFKFDMEFDRNMFIHVFGYDVLESSGF